MNYKNDVIQGKQKFISCSLYTSIIGPNLAKTSKLFEFEEPFGGVDAYQSFTNMIITREQTTK